MKSGDTRIIHRRGPWTIISGSCASNWKTIPASLSTFKLSTAPVINSSHRPHAQASFTNQIFTFPPRRVYQRNGRDPVDGGTQPARRTEETDRGEPAKLRGRVS